MRLETDFFPQGILQASVYRFWFHPCSPLMVAWLPCYWRSCWLLLKYREGGHKPCEIVWKKVISWTSWSLSLRFFWWGDQWRRVSYSLRRVRVNKFKFFLTGNTSLSASITVDSSEGRAEFRVDKEDIPLLINALQVPEYFRCPQGTGKAVRGGRGSDPVKKVNIIFNNKQINNLKHSKIST